MVNHEKENLHILLGLEEVISYFDKNIKKTCIKLLELKINKSFINKDSSRIYNLSINCFYKFGIQGALWEKKTLKFNLIFEMQSKS